METNVAKEPRDTTVRTEVEMTAENRAVWIVLGNVLLTSTQGIGKIETKLIAVHDVKKVAMIYENEGLRHLIRVMI